MSFQWLCSHGHKFNSEHAGNKKPSSCVTCNSENICKNPFTANEKILAHNAPEAFGNNESHGVLIATIHWDNPLVEPRYMVKVFNLNNGEYGQHSFEHKTEATTKYHDIKPSEYFDSQK